VCERDGYVGSGQACETGTQLDGGHGCWLGGQQGEAEGVGRLQLLAIVVADILLLCVRYVVVVVEPKLKTA